MTVRERRPPRSANPAARERSPRQSALGDSAPRTAPGAFVYTVSQLAAEARIVVEERFGRIWIEGEVSNYRAYASGHWYFSLKDERARVRCVMFASRNRFVRFRLADGARVVLAGRLSIYEANGDFQAVVDHVELAGEGALRAAFERLKAKLAAAGLFAEERKRPLPAFPRHIAVVSSRAGAALRDVLSVLRRRFPCVRVTCFDVAVQGLEAPPQILGALQRAERMRHPPEVIIVARGGGSLEDLAAFNDEAVVRRIAACRIPVVSAVGHETDFTLADFAADKRAPTPSAAAELVTPDAAETLARVIRLRRTLAARFAHRLRVEQRMLAGVEKRLVHPRRLLEQRMLRTDELQARMAAAMQLRLAQSRTRLTHQRSLLARTSPAARVAAAWERVAGLQRRLGGGIRARLDRAGGSFAAVARALAAVGPQATLKRGFAIVARPDGTRWGRPLTSVADATSGETVVAHLRDGHVRATVQGVSATPKAENDDA